MQLGERRSNCESRAFTTLFSFYKNVVFPAQVEYSYFSADFKAGNILVLFLNCSLLTDSSVLERTKFNNKL